MDALAPLKPILTALVLPPTSPILLLLVSLGLIASRTAKPGPSRRRRLGMGLAVLACAALWLCSTQGFARLLATHVLQLPAPLAQAELERLALQARHQPSSLAVLVLGGGHIPLAPEYGAADLTPASLERLRYGAWLSRRTGAPLAFSGGLGWGQPTEGPTEAEIAARIAQQEFGQTLRWQEGRSRDTRENAEQAVRLLREAGVRRIVLVTHAWHLPRALRFFREAAKEGGDEIQIEPAGVGYFSERGQRLLDWLPGNDGVQQSRWVLRELLALLVQG